MADKVTLCDSNDRPLGGVVAISAAPAVVAGAHTTGQCVGTVFSLAGAAGSVARGGVIQSATLRCLVSTSIAYDLFLLKEALTTSTATTNVDIAITAADITKIVGVINFPTSSLILGGASSMGIWTVRGIGLGFQANTGVTALSGLLVARGSVTFGTATAISLDLLVEQK